MVREESPHSAARIRQQHRAFHTAFMFVFISLVHAVAEFYNHESKHVWRKHLAARLLQLHLNQHELLNEVSFLFAAVRGCSFPSLPPFSPLLTVPRVCAAFLLPATHGDGRGANHRGGRDDAEALD